VIVQALLGGTLLLTVVISRARHVWFALALVVVVADLCAVAGLSLMAHHSQAAGIMAALSVCLVLGTPVMVLRDIANGRIVSTNSVLGAACAYLLFGVCFALIFGTIGAFTPGGFFESEAAGSASNYLFFSFTTLTTVGYGNLIPATSLGQSLAMTEALAGQIFLVVIVARLVSLWGQELPRYRQREEAD
jgi:voltage-gated potassium channel Kch